MRYPIPLGLCVLVLFSIFLNTESLVAQENSPYHFSFQREVVYINGGLLTLAGSEYLRRQIEPLEVSKLDVDITDFDDVQFRYGDHKADHFSDLSMYASAGLTALLIAKRDTRSHFGKVLLLFSETMLVNQGLTNLSKAVFRRPRPYVFAPDWSSDRRVLSGDVSSMVSGHTSGAAAGSFFFARVFSDYYPDSELKPLVWGVAATLPAITGFLRIRAAKHYPSDVVAGYALGAVIGYLVPTLHKKPLLKGRLHLTPTVTGINALYNLR